MPRTGPEVSRWSWRRTSVLALVLAGLAGLVGRAFYLQVLDRPFLLRQGDAREVRVIERSSHRGMILDRHGNPLAISTPVESVWAVPRELRFARADWPALAAALGLPPGRIARDVALAGKSHFIYLAREVSPNRAIRAMALGIPGVALQREYRRYYPSGPIAGQVVGVTNIDDQGQSGLELAYNRWLRARPGKMLVLKDGRGHVIEDVGRLQAPKPGRNLVTSLDARIQYLAYRALKNAVRLHDASSGSVIVLNARTGEVLALANEPAFNPNRRRDRIASLMNDRAVTDVFEPGSTMKPFTIAVALESGRYSPTTLIPTSPGTVRIGPNLIRDTADFGLLTVAGVIEKSSNVGASKIALTLSRQAMYRMFRAVGFGDLTGVALPGESDGLLSAPDTWVPVKQATLSFGYGIAVTPMQLARAYTAIANHGVVLPLTLLRRSTPPAGRRVMPARVAEELVRMLEMAAGPNGTAPTADVADYQVAGKTGTAHKADPGGYHRHDYIASFAGFAPASHPALITVVMINNPRRGGYYGAEVAAPVFREVMGAALRLLNIRPDAAGTQAPVLAGSPAGQGA
ncbi:MAG: peptidoglycan D,D-transpeptidase FtsI family protein [Acidiferrobacteraceae bacterium]